MWTILLLLLIRFYFTTNKNKNTPLHPAEKPPLNSTIPTGGGFKLLEPNKVGAWDFRSFTFSPSQIIVNSFVNIKVHALVKYL